MLLDEERKEYEAEEYRKEQERLLKQEQERLQKELELERQKAKERCIFNFYEKCSLCNLMTHVY